MTKKIKIGETEELFSASGALPIVYRDLTGRDFFGDLQNMSGGVDTSVIDMAWVMYRDANPDDVVDEVDWLRRFDFMDINEAIPEVITLLSMNQKTLSESKKNHEK